MWCCVRLQDQALAVGESLMVPVNQSTPSLSLRALRLRSTLLHIADVAGTLLGKLSPGGRWGAGAAAGRRPAAAAGGAPAEAERRIERMTSLQRAASSVPSM
jgi:hypothetical protein